MFTMHYYCFLHTEVHCLFRVELRLQAGQNSGWKWHPRDIISPSAMCLYTLYMFSAEPVKKTSELKLWGNKGRVSTAEPSMYTQECASNCFGVGRKQCSMLTSATECSYKLGVNVIFQWDVHLDAHLNEHPHYAMTSTCPARTRYVLRTTRTWSK